MAKVRIRDLFQTNWVALKRIISPDLGIEGYDYLDEIRCNGKIIAILPYKLDSENGIQFLLRKEFTPCWSLTSRQVSCITGGYEEKYGLEGTAVKELKEEAGYSVTENRLIRLGTCRGTKSTNTVYHLFSVDLTGVKEGESTGDGSALEDRAECYWDHGINDCVDPIGYTAYVKLVNKLMK